MHNALNAQELLYAQKLQRRGLLLREIAAQLDVSFQAVCLALYGDNTIGGRGKAGREDSPAPLTQQGFATPDSPGDGAGRPQSATLQSETSARVVPPRVDTPPVDTHPVANVGEDANGATAAASADPASREADDADRQQLAASGFAGAGVAASQPTHRDAADEPVREVAAPSEPDVAIETRPGQRFRLVSVHGESLHENERVLTRLPKFFWRGDASEVAALRRRRPQWSELRAVAVLSGTGVADAQD